MLQAVTNWPTPTKRQELQRIVGLSNFYHRFIWCYSSIATPLTALTLPKTLFFWNLESMKVFTKLRERFTSTLILTILDRSRQFIVEVDTTSMGVGDILSLRFVHDNKLHPAPFSPTNSFPPKRIMGSVITSFWPSSCI